MPRHLRRSIFADDMMSHFRHCHVTTIEYAVFGCHCSIRLATIAASRHISWRSAPRETPAGYAYVIITIRLLPRYYFTYAVARRYGCRIIDVYYADDIDIGWLHYDAATPLLRLMLMPALRWLLPPPITLRQLRHWP